MWRLSLIRNISGSQLWFSDGEPQDSIRGGNGVSSRLIIDTQGFIDFTELQLTSAIKLDMNGALIHSSIPSTIDLDDSSHPWVNITLTIPGDGTFVASASFSGNMSTNVASVTAKVKPLPLVSGSDIAFYNDMIAKKYVPYQNLPKPLGKSDEEIKELGTQLFPHSPYSYQLAMSLYDWTTSSFARVVFMKIFEYTEIPQTPPPHDFHSIAQAIWQSNWGPYVPGNADYMNSFMMKPVSSEKNVKEQLDLVAPQLLKLCDVHNRVLSAALQSLPRISLIARPHLFSGQVDVHQLGLDHFGIELLECPLNNGPITQPLRIDFDTVLSTYVSAGKVITTKVPWSFTDTFAEAMHYQNGIILVANVPADDASWVWETTAYITPLSADPMKTEYTFPHRSRFRVLSTEQATVQGKKITIINLQPLPASPATWSGPTWRDGLTVAPLTVDDIVHKASAYAPILEQQVQLLHEKDMKEVDISLHDAIPPHHNATHFKLAHKMSGRRCACIDALNKIF